MIEICKWKNDADSPVLLMVDDLSNVWVDTNGNGAIDLGEDWGYAKNGPNSSFRYLNEQLLDGYPDVKTTFFTPVACRAGLIDQGPIKRVAQPINSDRESINFFKDIHSRPKYEIAYHGTTHGRTGEDAQSFRQEWELFGNVPEAEAAIRNGIAVYQDVLGSKPVGGKYCGYVSNQYSDESINNTGFSWWCRYWNRGLIDERNCRWGGGDRNPITAFDIQFFGTRKVIDIPSTLSGALFTNLLFPPPHFIKTMIKKTFRQMLLMRKYREIDFLLEHKLIISIQEHIAPSRDDGRRQQPNIFDDITGLRMIFDYLKAQNVWYCTGTELAEYVQLREAVNLVKTDDHKFMLIEEAGAGAGASARKSHNPEITIKIARFPGHWIITPNYEKRSLINGVATIPVLNGEYEVI